MRVRGRETQLAFLLVLACAVPLPYMSFIFGLLHLSLFRVPSLFISGACMLARTFLTTAPSRIPCILSWVVREMEFVNILFCS